MFGFGWVRTHLRVVFGNAFRLFWGFWLDLWKNGRNQQNFGNFRGLTPWRKAWHVHAATWLRGGLDKPRVLFTAWRFLCFVLFCFSVAPSTCLLD